MTLREIEAYLEPEAGERQPLFQTGMVACCGGSMTVRDVAIVGRHNRYGLSRDADILRQALEGIGIQAAVFDAETCANPYTRNADGDGVVYE